MNAADTARATPFSSAAPDAARALATRCLALLADGATEDAREAAENALFLVESIPHEEIAVPASVAVGEALVALGDVRRARLCFEAAVNDRVWGQRAREGLERIRRVELPPLRASAGLRRAFDDA